MLVEVIEAKGNGRLKTMLLEEDNNASTPFSGIRIVKIGPASNEKTTTQQHQTDISLIKLEVTKELLEAEAEALADEADALKEEARTALAGKSRERALLILKRKKRLDAKINDKYRAIDNIEIIYQQVLDTDSQTAVARALTYANTVLKRQTANLAGIEETVSSVEDTLADIASLTAEANRPLNTDNSTALELDAEQELDELLKDIEEEKQKETEGLLDQLNELKIADGDVSSGSLQISEKGDVGGKLLDAQVGN